MAVTDFFAGEIATELLKYLLAVVKKSTLCRSSAENLIDNISGLLPIIQEIKQRGVELPQIRQTQVDDFSKLLRDGYELAGKFLHSGRWNMYRNLQLARKMERLEKRVARFMQVTMQAHVLSDVHHVRFNMEQRFDVLEHRLKAIKIGVDDSVVKRIEEDEKWFEDSFVNLGAGIELGKRKVKEMLTSEQDRGVFEICGIGGSSKLTLAKEICKDDQVKRKMKLVLILPFTFGHNSFLRGFNQKLVKEVVDECEGLPLALKVIESSLKGKTEIQPVWDSHELRLLEQMKLSIDCLPEKVRECFLDLGAFPEDKRIPLDVLINMWLELHDIDEEEAFHILVDLSDKDLLNLVKDACARDMYTSYYETSVFQHYVLRDLAIHMSNRDDVTQLPKEWKRNVDEPFHARVISVLTDQMGEMDWLRMDCPKAEVLILNFASSEYFLPLFLENMPKLRALIIINYISSNVVLHNMSVFSHLINLRSLWFEKISVTHLTDSTNPLNNFRKISLMLCDMKNSLDDSDVDLPGSFPQLSELTMDHCINFNKLPSSICQLHKLNSLSITNCDSLYELRSALGELQVLRIYACAHLKRLPPGIGHLVKLKYLDILQCLGLGCLPEAIGCWRNLEKIDMRECPQIEIFCQRKDVEKAVPGLCLQVPEECFTLDWLSQ
ncbi:unnamed protein product [Withania somnifera]